MERTSLESKFKISEIITSPLLRRPLEPKRFENPSFINIWYQTLLQKNFLENLYRSLRLMMIILRLANNYYFYFVLWYQTYIKYFIPLSNSSINASWNDGSQIKYQCSIEYLIYWMSPDGFRFLSSSNITPYKMPQSRILIKAFWNRFCQKLSKEGLRAWLPTSYGRKRPSVPSNVWT